MRHAGMRPAFDVHDHQTAASVSCD